MATILARPWTLRAMEMMAGATILLCTIASFVGVLGIHCPTANIPEKLIYKRSLFELSIRLSYAVIKFLSHACFFFYFPFTWVSTSLIVYMGMALF